VPIKTVIAYTGLIPKEIMVVDTGPAADRLYPVVSDTGAPAYRWLQYVNSRIKSMSQRDGDSDLPAVSEIAVKAAYDVAWRYFPPSVPSPLVGTTLDGGVEFVWHRGGWDLEIEVSPQAEVTVWGRKRGSGASFGGPLEEYKEQAYDVLIGFAVES